MPKNSKVGRCVKKVSKREGKVKAIRICQKSTGQSYKTGRKPMKGMKKRKKR